LKYIFLGISLFIKKNEESAMHRFSLLLLILCFFSSLSAQQPILSYLTSENDMLSLVDDTVDAYNGKLVQMDKDIEVQGVHPLELQRYYDGGHHFDGDVGYGYGFSFPLLLMFTPESGIQNLTVEQRAGFEVVCTVVKQRSEKKKGRKTCYKGGVDPEFFQNGYTNCCEALLRGDPSLLALQVVGDEDQFTVTLGDGTKRHYSFLRYDYVTIIYRLIREDYPDGCHRHYSYVDNETLSLKCVWTTDPGNTFALNHVNFSYNKTSIQADASNGQSVCYYLKNQKGTAKNYNLLNYSSVKFSKSILEKVTGKHLPTCEYDALSRSHYTCTLFSTKKVSFPDGRFIKVDYDDHERVYKLWSSGLDRPLYEFDYHHDRTTVVDAKGGIQRFFYNNRRLAKHEEPHRVQHYGWDNQGQLARQILTDHNNLPFIDREYHYDPRGNVLEAKVTANIRESGSNDIYAVRYHYSDDGRNLLVCEEHPEGHTISYGYIPNTNLLFSKLTWITQGILEREFYTYDPNGIRIFTINDDGTNLDPADFTNVSYRKFTEVTPQLDVNLPGMTLPKVIQEGYQEATGVRHILKRIERTYCQGDLLAEEKIFDAQGKYCYSRRCEYNDRRQLVSETDPLGYQTNYQYDNNGNKTFEEKIHSGRKVIYAYDNANHLIKESECLDDGSIFTTSHTYDPMGNRQETTDIFGQKSTSHYDLASREISATDPLGFTVHKAYDIHGNITHQIDQDGHLTVTLYNLYGKPLEIHYPDGTSKRFIYNVHGHLIYEKERDGLETHYDVDYLGRVKVAISHVNGVHLKVIQKAYKGANLVSETDPLGNQTSYAYDGAGRLISKELGGILTRFEYDPLGRISKTITPERTEVKEYDYLDRIVEERIEDHSGTIFCKTCYSYDINGNCISQKNYQNADLFAETKTHFNSRNLPILMVDACGNQTSITYHYSDHLKKEILDPLGRKKLEIYDPLQRLKEVQHYSPSGLLFAHRAFVYDGRGNQTLHNENILYEGQSLGNYLVSTVYDSMGQKLSETEQNKKTTQYRYHLGRLQEIINPDGITLSHIYDQLGRLTRLTSSDATIDYQYTYDGNDNLLSAEDLIHKTIVKRSYDVFNRQIHEKQATGFEIAFAYDAIDRLKEVCFDNHKISYEYQPSSLISAKRYQNNNLVYQYDQTTDWRGKALSCCLPNKSTITYSWDSLGRCSGIDSSSYQQTMVYNAVGNLTDLSVNDPQGPYTTTFTYDDSNQLISETGPYVNEYLFDSVHNRRNKNASATTVNDLNQVTNDNTSQYTYDPNGRRLKKEGADYTYDALGRLTKFTNGEQCIQYTYDPFGRLMERCAGGSCDQYLYQFDTEIASFEKGKISTLRPIYGIHAPFAIELEGIVYSPIRNHRGDVCVLLNNSQSVGTYRYNAFGEFLHQGEIHSPWLLSGQRYDADTGLYHFAKREYDPVLGAWLTPDPLGFADGPNLYAYVNNNPLIYIDPYGLWRTDPGRLISEDREMRANEFRDGARRGFIDDSSFGASEAVLGEHQHTSLSNRIGYYAGTGASLGLGLAYGGTWVKGSLACTKYSLSALRSLKTTLNIGSKGLKHTRTVTRLAKDAEPAVQKAYEGIFKPNTATREVVGEASNVGKQKNFFAPDVKATWTHTRFRGKFDIKTDNYQITNYETFKFQTNPRNPNPWESVLRLDNGNPGTSHYNKVLKRDIYEPHVHDPKCPGGLREAQQWEIPKY
jgi:RHS repeat-associated protein